MLYSNNGIMSDLDENEWIEDEEEDLEYPVEYVITSSPNDFNIKTLFDFIESGVVKLPVFQRNYVWDKKKASRLIESIILGLPVPQIFLYEMGKNKFLMIDGQQRLMTIFYFIKGRFPRQEKRAELRKIFDEKGLISADILNNDVYFSDFTLNLPSSSNKPNRLDGLSYVTLNSDDKATFELRTIRNVIIKQHEPKDNSSMYEIFYRLNTGGVNLKPQEIRTVLYHSHFYDMLNTLNVDERWRRLTKIEIDTHMRDIEILLRGFAMLINGESYKPSMASFLNKFSEDSKSFSPDKITYLKKLFDSFLNQCSNLPNNAFLSQTGRFSISIYEAVFTVVCSEAYRNENFVNVKFVDPEKLAILKKDPEFSDASQYQTTSKENVELRLKRAKEILLG